MRTPVRLALGGQLGGEDRPAGCGLATAVRTPHGDSVESVRWCPPAQAVVLQGSREGNGSRSLIQLLLGAPVSALAAEAPLGLLAFRRGRSPAGAVLLAVVLALVVMASAAFFLAFLSDASPGDVGSYVVAGGALMLVALVGIGLLVLWFARSARRIPDEPSWPTPTPRFPDSG